MAAVDQMIGRYRLSQRLGQGGMGEVWKAVDTGVTQREVAVKLVISEDDPAMLHALADEARSMAALPLQTNLVALLDVVESDGSLALVMEYVPGPTLRQVLRTYPGGLPWGLIAPMAEGLLAGLEHAHGHQIIHRDLKPENVKLHGFDGSKTLRASQVKILDFGLARVQKEQSTRFTRGAAGTFTYMAPEQLTGQPQSEATDFYAFGILLFEMATGQPPFGGPGKESFGAIYQGHTSEPPPLPSLKRGDTPEGFDLALLACLAKQPSARPGSAEDLADLLLPGLRRAAGDRDLVAPIAETPLPSVEAGTRPTGTPKASGPVLPSAPMVEGNATVLDARALPKGAPSPSPSPSPKPVTGQTDASSPGVSGRTMRWMIAVGVVALGVMAVAVLRQWPASAPATSAVNEPPSPAEVASSGPLSAPSGSFTNSFGMTLVPIPADSFLMGSTESVDEQPVHRVTFARGFHMGQTEVTQGQWEAIMGTRPWAGKDYVQSGPDYPAVYVSWEDAQAFCRALSAKEGRTYRLPSEAEWEYAARAGSTGKWCFGDDEGRLGDHAWFDQNASDIGERYAHRVGTKKANAWGLHDLHGNVWEWCEDRYHTSYQGAPESGEAWVNGDHATHVFRGGGFDVYAASTRSASRNLYTPDYRYVGLGFRVVCAPRT